MDNQGRLNKYITEKERLVYTCDIAESSCFSAEAL